MKKLLSLVVAASLLLVLAACDDKEPEVVPTIPTLSGISALVTKTAGDTFDPLAGAAASDEIDGDITADIAVDGTACLQLDASNVLTTGGISCTLTYTVENSNGLSAMKISIVTVEKAEATVGENMVSNGTFDTDTTGWNKLEVEGGAALVSAVDGEMKVEITTVGWSGTAFPRLDQGGMTYENGKTYVVTFDARADVARKLSSQVGVFLSGAPWFINYDEQHVFELTTTMETYTYTFTVVESGVDANIVDTTSGVITLEMGLFEGDPEGGIATTVYFDNISITELVE